MKHYVSPSFRQRNAVGASHCQSQSCVNKSTLSPALGKENILLVICLCQPINWTTMLVPSSVVHQTILSCSRGSKSSSQGAGGLSSSLPGRGVLMWMPASEDIESLLSGRGLSLRESWEEEEEQEGFSGIKRATRKAMTTVHAPKRKGGPGMSAR